MRSRRIAVSTRAALGRPKEILKFLLLENSQGSIHALTVANMVTGQETKNVLAPGAGLARKPSSSAATSKQKQRPVRIAEGCHADHLPDGSPDSLSNTTSEPIGVHEASVVSHDEGYGIPLDQALLASMSLKEHSALTSATSLQALSEDKRWSEHWT